MPDTENASPKQAPHSGVDDNNKKHPKGADELNQNVVAQGNVAMTNKSKASFRMPTVRKSSRRGMGVQPVWGVNMPAGDKRKGIYQ